MTLLRFALLSLLFIGSFAFANPMLMTLVGQLGLSHATKTPTGVLTTIPGTPPATGAYPHTIAVSSDGKNLYSANMWSNTISAYSINSTSGVLTPLLPDIATGNTPQDLALSPDGTYLYVANYADSVVGLYIRDASTGLLSYSGIAASVPHACVVRVSPDGKSVYVLDYDDSSVYGFSRNMVGLLTALATPSFSIAGNLQVIEISPDNKSVYAGNYSGGVALLSRNTSTGELTAGSVATSPTTAGIAISPDSRFVYSTNANSNYTISTFSRNTSTGALTLLGTTPSPSLAAMQAITVTPDGGSLYVTSYDFSNPLIGQFSRDGSTGALTALSPAFYTTGRYGWGMAVTPNSKFVYDAISGDTNILMFKRY